MTTEAVILVVGVLVGVILLIAATARFVQLCGWRPQSPSGRTLRLCESIALDTRRRVHLIQCGQRQVVVLTGGAQDLVIGWIKDP
jgi:flagellar protein FliO/FliZ